MTKIPPINRQEWEDLMTAKITNKFQNFVLQLKITTAFQNTFKTAKLQYILPKQSYIVFVKNTNWL